MHAHRHTAKAVMQCTVHVQHACMHACINSNIPANLWLVLRAGGRKPLGRCGTGTSRSAQTGQWSDPMHSVHKSDAVNRSTKGVSCKVQQVWAGMQVTSLHDISAAQLIHDLALASLWALKCNWPVSCAQNSSSCTAPDLVHIGGGR